jgi:3-oxoadipate enol-lactonase
MPILEYGRQRIHYRCDGADTAPPLVLSNSLGTDLGLWQAQVPALAERFRVVRYDTRGHGGSSIADGPLRIDDLASDVLRLIDALGIERAHFCGLSLGGMIGMWLGTHAPERIDRLVLANTSARIAPPELWEARIAAVRAGGMARIVDAVLERWFTTGFRAREAETVARIRRMLETTPAEGYIACCAAIRDMDQRESVAAIRAPTLVIAGSADVATPPENARVLVERIAGARYHELPTAHLSNIEEAAAFTAAVVAFLAGPGAAHG